MLSRMYPTVRAAGTEIINLQAILNLPKGCEHFISDVHGEHEAFLHILNSCSGVVRERIDLLFADTAPPLFLIVPFVWHPLGGKHMNERKIADSDFSDTASSYTLSPLRVLDRLCTWGGENRPKEKQDHDPAQEDRAVRRAREEAAGWEQKIKSIEGAAPCPFGRAPFPSASKQSLFRKPGIHGILPNDKPKYVCAKRRLEGL